MLPEGLEMVDLNGHSFSMVGIKTKDDVWFLGDSVASHDTIQKHHITFLYNVEEYFHSLDVVEKLEGKLFIPSHMDPVENIMCYPIKIKQNAKEIDLYPLPNSVPEGRDYIWRNQNLNFININK